jgi:hypothetical protein
LIATANPTDSLDAHVQLNVAVGTYYVKVGGAGAYGDVGQYTLHVQDLNAPRIIAASPTSVSSTLDGLWVTFNKPIDAATFTTSDVTLLGGPLGGGTVISVTPVIIDGDDRTFLVTFTKGAAVPGLKIGPNIEDYFGNLMDQDRDFIAGEALEDQFVWYWDGNQSTSTL